MWTSYQTTGTLSTMERTLGSLPTGASLVLVILIPITSANSESANCAVAGVVGGHQIKAKSWFEAVSLHNSLYHQGNIILVSA